MSRKKLKNGNTNPQTNYTISLNKLLAIFLDENASKEFVYSKWNKIDWEQIITHEKLPEWFIIRYRYLLDWDLIMKHQHLTENILEKCFSCYDICEMCKYANMPISFIESHFDVFKKDAMEELCRYQKLTTTFMKLHKDELDWSTISECQTLSMNFMEDMKHYLDWTWISMKQDFSPWFIKKYKNRLNMTALLRRNIPIPKELGTYFDINVLRDKWKEGEKYGLGI